MSSRYKNNPILKQVDIPDFIKELAAGNIDKVVEVLKSKTIAAEFADNILFTDGKETLHQ